MKTCYKCQQEKPFDQFYLNSRGAGGRSHECKSCANKRSAERRKSRPDKISEANLRYNQKNRIKARQTVKAWRQENPERCQLHRMNYSEAYRNAVPKWLTDQHWSDIRCLYTEAKSQGMHVDHIIPLQGKTVCGLHVPWNLQLLPPLENIKKGNRIVECFSSTI